MIERIEVGGEEVAIIIRPVDTVDGISFVTPPESSMQIGMMRRPVGYKIAPHVHKKVVRRVSDTHEVLVIRDGRIRVNFYDHDRNVRQVCELEKGDIILLCGGGHGFEFLADADVVEIKQGPYAGDDDKERF